jgi:hypothetical protein
VELHNIFYLQLLSNKERDVDDENENIGEVVGLAYIVLQGCTMSFARRE